MRISLTTIFLIFSMLSALANADGEKSIGEANDIGEEIEKLLDAIGGAEVWANAAGFTMHEINHVDTRELPTFRQYWVDFSQPRIKEVSIGRDFRQTRAVNEHEGWTLKNGDLSYWSDETADQWRSFWRGIPTRVFHLLASKHPSVKPLLRDGVIDVYIENERVIWIATAEDGTPVAYGRDNRHTDTHFLGKPLKYSEVKLWSKAFEPGGNWSVTMLDYELLQEPHTESFAAPTKRNIE